MDQPELLAELEAQVHEHGVANLRFFTQVDATGLEQLELLDVRFEDGDIKVELGFKTE